MKADKQLIKETVVNDSRLIKEMDFVRESLQLEDSWRTEDEFMIAPFSFMSETVTHNGLKTWSEICKTWRMWENRPVCFDHPQTEVVMDPEDVIGYIRNVEKNEEKKRLEAELWILKDRPSFSSASDSFWSSMLEALKERDEISAGYYTIIEDSEGTFTDICGNEMDYEKKYTQILPDHIASVRKGACSPDQGCGIGIESVNEDDDNLIDNSERRVTKVQEEDKTGILKKISGALNELLHGESDGCPEETETNVSECEENEEMTVEEENECEEENEQEEQCETSDLEEKVAEKEQVIGTLKNKVSELKEQVEQHRQNEYEELVKEAVRETTLDEETIRENDRDTVRALIEGARSSRSSVTDEKETTVKEDGGKNLRSPPGGTDDSGPEIVDVYSHPLDNQ